MSDAPQGQDAVAEAKHLAEKAQQELNALREKAGADAAGPSHKREVGEETSKLVESARKQLKEDGVEIKIDEDEGDAVGGILGNLDDSDLDFSGSEDYSKYLKK